MPPNAAFVHSLFSRQVIRLLGHRKLAFLYIVRSSGWIGGINIHKKPDCATNQACECDFFGNIHGNTPLTAR